MACAIYNALKKFQTAKAPSHSGIHVKFIFQTNMQRVTHYYAYIRRKGFDKK